MLLAEEVKIMAGVENIEVLIRTGSLRLSEYKNRLEQ